MIIVNTPGDSSVTFAPLLHANWHGFIHGFCFPIFPFAVGNAISFVMLKWAGLPQSTVLWKILKRTAIIFLLGYLMYWFPFFFAPDKTGAWHLRPIAETRIFGVLQRITPFCYGIASLMIYYLSTRWVIILYSIIPRWL